MNRKDRRRNRTKNFVKVSEALDQMVVEILRGADDGLNVTLGPVVWQVQPGYDTRQWYFCACSGNEHDFWSVSIGGEDEQHVTEIRAEIMVQLTQRKPIVLHDFDDELEMAKWCEAIWPGPKTRKIRMGIEAERR